jgi:hypothetical protein
MGDVPGGVTVGPAPQVIPSVPTLQEALAEANPAPVASMMVVGPLAGVQDTPIVDPSNQRFLCHGQANPVPSRV